METRDRTDVDQTPGPKQRKRYAKPELVRYGALEEITRGYTDVRSCKTTANRCYNG
jgi:hypothetical protein